MEFDLWNWPSFAMDLRGTKMKMIRLCIVNSCSPKFNIYGKFCARASTKTSEQTRFMASNLFNFFSFYFTSTNKLVLSHKHLKIIRSNRIKILMLHIHNYTSDIMLVKLTII